MPSRDPFFEPLPAVEDEPEGERLLGNLPWVPPLNVVPVLLPLSLDVAATDSVVIRLGHALVYDRGLELHLQAWLHPESLPRIEGAYGMWSEPRVGLLLGDGTKVGATAKEPVPQEIGDTESTILTRTDGGSSDLRLTQTWWVRPVPEGPFELVVSWSDVDVPETFVPLDGAAMRTVGGGARELWPLADIEGDFGWFAYTPGDDAAYRPQRYASLDRDSEG